mmetsp:Transcript_23521/g.51378  ORF Transcript_23521/g.51378 Transcript_23521/m.51378 type:complete len:334 (-) Transcript_23521:551-1552(-)
MHEFLCLRRAPTQLFSLSIKTKFANVSLKYFQALGLLPRAPPQHVEMAAFTPAAIRDAFGGCRDQVLAFTSLFAAFDVKPLGASPREWRVGGQEGLPWLDQTVLPALLSPQPRVAEAAQSIVQRITSGGCGGRPCKLACVHVRRGDFVDECKRYMEEANSKAPRQWLKYDIEQGWGCFQSDEELELNLEALERSEGGAVVTYVATENPAILQAPSLRRFGLKTLDDFPDLTAQLAAETSVSRVSLALVDQLVCAAASTLLLNVFSTFSQLIMTRIGLQHKRRVGWVRDLSQEQQARLGIRVRFLQRIDRLRNMRRCWLLGCGRLRSLFSWTSQ